MLIEFSVENYRSIGETQTLSLVAKGGNELKESVCECSFPGIGEVQLSKVAAIYGANASGKSNVFKALRFMQYFVVDSATEIKPSEKVQVQPFRLSEAKRGEPSLFEVHFTADGIRYRYGFRVDSDRVHSEWLYSFPKGRKRLFFVREYDHRTADTEYTDGKHYKVDSQLAAKTRENALFLSVAAQFNDEQLLPAYEWFQGQLRLLDFSWSKHFSLDTSVNIAVADASRRKHMARMLQMADLGIEDFEIEVIQVEEKDLPADLPREVREELIDSGIADICFVHKGDQESRVKFRIQDESGGTQKLFALAGPWTDMMNQELCVFIDELGANMHPLLTQGLIRLLCRTQKSSPCTQLLFTTHDMTLLDQSFLRRDQVWFTEKNHEGETELYPLTDYRPRKNEALQKGYLAGRYGALPLLTGDLAFDDE